MMRLPDGRRRARLQIEWLLAEATREMDTPARPTVRPHRRIRRRTRPCPSGRWLNPDGDTARAAPHRVIDSNPQDVAWDVACGCLRHHNLAALAVDAGFFADEEHVARAVDRLDRIEREARERYAAARDARGWEGGRRDNAIPAVGNHPAAATGTTLTVEQFVALLRWHGEELRRLTATIAKGEACSIRGTIVSPDDVLAIARMDAAIRADLKGALDQFNGRAA